MSTAGSQRNRLPPLKPRLRVRILMSALRAPDAVHFPRSRRCMFAPTAPPLLHYTDTGTGPPLLFVHAFPFSGSMWEPQVAPLAGEFGCIVPDLPGFGGSAAGEPWTMDRFANDLARVLDDAGVAAAVVCGLSLGGYVALALQRLHPDRIRALILADTRASADTEEGRRKREATIALAREAGASAVADQAITGLLGKSTRERAPELVADAHARAAAASVEAIVGASRAMMDRPDSTAMLAGIRVPTLVIVGDEDTITPPREARAMADAIPDARLEIIPGAGHLTNFERPAAFTCAVRDFIVALPER